MKKIKLKNVIFALLFFLFGIGIYGLSRLTIVNSPVIGFAIAFFGLIILVLITKKIK